MSAVDNEIMAHSRAEGIIKQILMWNVGAWILQYYENSLIVPSIRCGFRFPFSVEDFQKLYLSQCYYAISSFQL